MLKELKGYLGSELGNEGYFVTLTRGDRDMSLKVPFCRAFLEHLNLTLTNETFQVVILDFYLHTEQKSRSEKGQPTHL